MLVTLFFASNIILPLVDVISDILTAKEMLRFDRNYSIMIRSDLQNFLVPLQLMLLCHQCQQPLYFFHHKDFDLKLHQLPNSIDCSIIQTCFFYSSSVSVSLLKMNYLVGYETCSSVRGHDNVIKSPLQKCPKVSWSKIHLINSVLENSDNFHFWHIFWTNLLMMKTQFQEPFTGVQFKIG